MTYQTEGFTNRTLLKSSSFLNSECLIPNPQFTTWIQFDFLVKTWIHSLVTHGMNAMLVGNLSAREQWFVFEERFDNTT